jgi:hypothetical protein
MPNAKSVRVWTVVRQRRFEHRSAISACLLRRLVRTHGDLEALKTRRPQAAAMFDKYKRQVDVAVALGVSAQTGSRWCGAGRWPGWPR